MAKVWHFARFEGFFSLLTSQLLRPLSLHPDDDRPGLIVYTPIGNLLRRRNRDDLNRFLASARDDFGIDTKVIYGPPKRLDRLWDVKDRLNAALPKQQSEIIVHCRNAQATEIALRLKQQREMKVIFDCRGATPYEVQQRLEGAPDSRKQVQATAAAEENAARNADAIVCVSTRLADYLQNEYQANRADLIVPCCPDVERFSFGREAKAAARQELGLPQDVSLLTYVGSLAWYQNIEKILEFVSKVMAERANFQFLAFTSSTEKMRDLCQRNSIPADKTNIHRATPQQMTRLLCAGDFGLLFRDNTIVNRVASPVKFGEYLAAGLRPVVTANIGDYSRSVADEELGLVVPDHPGEAARQFLDAELPDASIVRDFAMKNLCWPNYIPAIRELYEWLETSDKF